MVPLTGLEPAAYRLGICRSILLSYRGLFNYFIGLRCRFLNKFFACSTYGQRPSFSLIADFGSYHKRPKKRTRQIGVMSSDVVRPPKSPKQKSRAGSSTGLNKPAFKKAIPKSLNVKLNFSLTPFYFLLILPRRNQRQGLKRPSKKMVHWPITIHRRLFYAIHSSSRVCFHCNGDPLRRPPDDWLRRFLHGR